MHEKQQKIPSPEILEHGYYTDSDARKEGFVLLSKAYNAQAWFVMLQIWEQV